MASGVDTHTHTLYITTLLIWRDCTISKNTIRLTLSGQVICLADTEQEDIFLIEHSPKMYTVYFDG